MTNEDKEQLIKELDSMNSLSYGYGFIRPVNIRAGWETCNAIERGKDIIKDLGIRIYKNTHFICSSKIFEKFFYIPKPVIEWDKKEKGKGREGLWLFNADDTNGMQREVYLENKNLVDKIAHSGYPSGEYIEPVKFLELLQNDISFRKDARKYNFIMIKCLKEGFMEDIKMTPEERWKYQLPKDKNVSILALELTKIYAEEMGVK